ncbi:MAG: mechanosensitive ion channel family protein, partial [Planctomycetota bacterium]
EVDGKRGVVETIGARATDLRNVGGANCLLPNSMLLESAVVNWHHHDDRVRARVAVGVAYGSPCERVRELLLLVPEEVEEVLTDPAPAVLFREFGDNSLAFELLAWCRPRNAFDWLRIESELRFAIDRLFRENDIVIAFPQRDVHLDSTAPVRVEMVR